MLATGISLSLLVAAGDPSGWIASVQSTVRGASEPPYAQPDGARTLGGEAELAGRFGLSLQDAPVSASVLYRPKFLLRRAVTGELSGAPDSTHQAGDIEFGTRLARKTHVAVYVRGDWGLTDFSPLSRIAFPGDSPPPTGQPTPAPVPVNGTGSLVPSARFVHTLDLDGGLGFAHQFSRGLELSLGAGFHRNGGFGHDDVQLLPLQSGPEAMAGLGWTLDPENTLSLRATATQNRFSADRSSLLSDLKAGWMLRPTREWRLEASAGAAFVRTEEAGLRTDETQLSGALRVRWAPPNGRARRLGASLGVSLVPATDPFTGQAMQTVRSDCEFEASRREWLFAVTGSAGRVLSGPAARAHDFAVGTRASWAFASAWTLESGVGAGHTNQAPIAGWRSEIWMGLRWSGGGRL